MAKRCFAGTARTAVPTLNCSYWFLTDPILYHEGFMVTCLITAL